MSCPSAPSRRLILLTCGLVLAASYGAALAAVPETLLVTESLPLPLPAFHDAENAGTDLEAVFGALPGAPGRGRPAAGRGFAGPVGREITWRESGEATFAPPEEGAAVGYAACYLVSDRWQKADLSVFAGRPVRGVLDGADLDLAGTDTLQAELTLTAGSHLLVLRTLYDPATDGDWSLGIAVAPDSSSGDGSLALTTSPTRATDIHLVLDAPRVSDVVLSPDGEQVAVSLGEYRNGADQETWLEIRSTRDGALLKLWRGDGQPRGLRWVGDGQLLSWRTDTDDKATVWLHDPEAGTTVAALADVDHLGTWRWTPDGTSLIYEINREAEPDPARVKRVAHPADRQPWWRNRSDLWQTFVPDGFTRRLTAGPVSPSSWRIAPDGGRLLFFLGEQDLTERPYFSSELWLLDLETLAAERLLDDRWLGGAEFSPDGKQLLLSGSASAFDGLGRDLPEGVQPNDYGGQLYLWDLTERQPRTLTRDLDPAVNDVAWTAADDRIYAICGDTQYRRVFRLRVPEGDDAPAWEAVETGVEVVRELQLPRRGRTAVVRGTSVTTPNRVFAVDLKKNKAREILDPGADAWRDVVFGEVEPWVAELPGGERLDGRIHYPPDFDPDRKWPVIVYYYGGTSPITRDFGGRYPKNVWTAHGYVVYVPNPSGATGYGQEFAARHVNDWGILTADEVIEGTRAFLAAHPFADAGNVACMGASYGGFLTEYVLTRTDLFAAGISHAGISDISSYWGEGFWGYSYGARALAGAFPWADRELYVEQSPLFHADKITTPLLLLHGDADTNVPKGESDQLFIALKLLGREVEYVQIQGQNHWIVDHDQRIHWNDTILAWLARQLKDRPQWWDALYAEPEGWR